MDDCLGWGGGGAVIRPVHIENWIVQVGLSEWLHYRASRVRPWAHPYLEVQSGNNRYVDAP